ncbi:MAG: hypothetical protein WC938_01655 [Candidatus Paceibacterota bacterium]|jgi:hypothetical protein
MNSGVLLIIVGLIVMISGFVVLCKSDDGYTEKMVLSVLLIVCGFAGLELGIFQVLVSML